MKLIAWIVLAAWMGTAALGAHLFTRRDPPPRPPPPVGRAPQVLARRSLGVNRDGLEWFAYLARIHYGPWSGWYAVRAIGWADENVVGEVPFDTFEEASAAYHELEAP